METNRILTTYLIQLSLLSQLFSAKSIQNFTDFYQIDELIQEDSTLLNYNVTFNKFGGPINVRGLFNHGTARDNKNIKDHLFTRLDSYGSEYDAEVLPLPHIEYSGNGNEKNDPLNIVAKIELLELTKFDTLNEELNVLIELTLRWNDYRLKFDYKNFNNVHKIDVPFTRVWTPNIGVTNDITGQSRFTTEDNTNKVEIWQTGNVVWKQTSAKIVKCKLDLKRFPFDLQKCTLTLDALTDQGKVNLTLFRDDDNFDTKQELNLWKIVGSKLSKSKKPVDDYCFICKPIRYTIILKRISSSYITDIIVPCTLLCLLSGFSLWIEAGNSQRLELNLSVLVAISVYQLLASANLPTGEKLPDLTLFLLIQNILVFMSIVTTLALWQFKAMLKHGVFSYTQEDTINTNDPNIKLKFDTIKANDPNIKFTKLKLPIRKFFYKLVVDYVGFLIFMRFDPEFQGILNKVEEIEDYLKEMKETDSQVKKVKNFLLSGRIDVDTTKSDKEKEFKLVELKMRLFLITIDRFFAVLYLLILFSWVIWIFVVAPDDDKTIEEFWRLESEM